MRAGQSATLPTGAPTLSVIEQLTRPIRLDGSTGSTWPDWPDWPDPALAPAPAGGYTSAFPPAFEGRRPGAERAASAV